LNPSLIGQEFFVFQGTTVLGPQKRQPIAAESFHLRRSLLLRMELAFFLESSKAAALFKKPRLDRREFCRTPSFATRAGIQSRTRSQRIDRSGRHRTLRKLYFTPTTTLVNPCVCVLILNALKCSICLVISLSEVTFSKGNELNL
jgi:hypothetical protein